MIGDLKIRDVVTMLADAFPWWWWLVVAMVIELAVIGWRLGQIAQALS